MPKRRSLYMVSLGCPKNRVDSEILLGEATSRGCEIVGDPDKADIILVNTCGFIESAKRESIDAIFEMASHKESGRCSQLVVTGCLVQRHHAELAAEIPEIDHLLGSGDLMRLGDVLDGKAPRDATGSAAGYLVHATDRRVITTGKASAYIKIAEGCDRRCAYCIIPVLRGTHRSRPLEDIVREAEQLAAQGVTEVNLVSQGHDRLGPGSRRSCGQSPLGAGLSHRRSAGNPLGAPALPVSGRARRRAARSAREPSARASVRRHAHAARIRSRPSQDAARAHPFAAAEDGRAASQVRARDHPAHRVHRGLPG